MVSNTALLEEEKHIVIDDELMKTSGNDFPNETKIDNSDISEKLIPVRKNFFGKRFSNKSSLFKFKFEGYNICNSEVKVTKLSNNNYLILGQIPKINEIYKESQYNFPDKISAYELLKTTLDLNFDSVPIPPIIIPVKSINPKTKNVNCGLT